MSANEERLIEVKEVAARLGISVRGVWRLVAMGLLNHPVKVISGTRWFESDVAAYFFKLKQQREGALH